MDLNPWCYKERKFGHTKRHWMCVHRESQEASARKPHPLAKKRGLRGNQTGHLDLGLLASKTVIKKIAVV